MGWVMSSVRYVYFSDYYSFGKFLYNDMMTVELFSKYLRPYHPHSLYNPAFVPPRFYSLPLPYFTDNDNIVEYYFNGTYMSPPNKLFGLLDGYYVVEGLKDRKLYITDNPSYVYFNIPCDAFDSSLLCDFLIYNHTHYCSFIGSSPCANYFYISSIITDNFIYYLRLNYSGMSDGCRQRLYYVSSLCDVYATYSYVIVSPRFLPLIACCDFSSSILTNLLGVRYAIG